MIATEFIIKNVISEIIFDTRICESLKDRFLVNYIYDTLNEGQFLDGEPITIDELRNLLRKQIVNFKFIKLDGDIRPARGTTKLSLIPQIDHPKGVRPSSNKVATFFDLSKDAWRSVSNRSKEIALYVDPETHKKEIIISDKKPKIEPTKKEPIVKPEITKEPEKPEIAKEPIYPGTGPEPRPEPKLEPGIPPRMPVQQPLDIDNPAIQASTVKDNQIVAPEEKQIPEIETEENEENEENNQF